VTDRAPEGWLDAAACDGLRGWARDPDADVPIDIVFTIDGALFAPGSSAFRTNAGIHRDDVGDHGFSMPVPYGYMDGRDHLVFAYGIGAAGGGSALLSGSPGTLHCDAPPPPFPNGVRRHVTDPTSFAAWRFADSDIVIVDDATLARYPDSDPWPAAPELFAAAGDPAVYLRDVRNGAPARRHVPSPDAMASWRLDWGAIAAVDLAARDTFAPDTEISTRPYLVRGSGPAVYVVDAPPPVIPSTDDASTPPSTSDAGVSFTSDGSMTGARSDGGVVHGVTRPSAGGCSASRASSSTHGVWLWALASALLVLARRR
jgi:hypothetical protein